MDNVNDWPVLNSGSDVDFLLVRDAKYGWSKLPFTQAGTFLALDPAINAATRNAEQIQAALDKGGLIHIGGDGVFYVNKTLVIGSHTHLRIAPRVMLKQSAASNKSMCVNRAAVLPQTATVTIAWTEGSVATVTWAEHGLDTSDYVCFQGANQTEFNNVFRVNEVIDANSFTIRLYRRGTATGSGTITGTKCDKNFVIEGGDWDYNFAENPSSPQTPNRHAIVIAFAGNFALRDVITRNAYKYGLSLCATSDYLVERFGSYRCADMLKQYGPCANAKFNGVFGESDDDGFTIQAKEPAAFIAYQQAFGDVFGVLVENVNVAANGPTHAGGVVVYASDNEQIERLRFKNVLSYAKNGNGIVLKNGDTFTGTLGEITVENANSSGKTGTNYCVSVGCNVRKLVIDGFNPAAADLTTQLIRQENTSTINVLRISGVRFRNTSWSSAVAYMINLNGNVDAAEISEVDVSLSTSNGRFLTLGTGTLGPITFRNVNIDGVSRLMIVNAGGANTRQLNIIGCRFKAQAGASGILCQTLTVINLQGNALENWPNGFVSCLTTAGKMAIVHGDGNQILGTTVAVVCSGSSMADIVSLSIPVDPAATGILTTAGNIAKRLATGRIMRADGAVWADV